MDLTLRQGLIWIAILLVLGALGFIAWRLLEGVEFGLPGLFVIAVILAGAFMINVSPTKR